MPIISLGTFGVIGSLIALIMGIAVLTTPKLLRYLIGFYLIIIGILGILSYI